MKYIIEEVERWKSNGNYKENDMVTYSVREVGGKDWEGIGVWYSLINKTTHCVACQGILSGMLSTCKHCNAVKRHVKKLSDG